MEKIRKHIQIGYFHWVIKSILIIRGPVAQWIRSPGLTLGYWKFHTQYLRIPVDLSFLLFIHAAKQLF